MFSTTVDADSGRSKTKWAQPAYALAESTCAALGRWRPIQAFVALTPNDGKEQQGGFEVVPDFHKEFADYFAG